MGIEPSSGGGMNLRKIKWATSAFLVLTPPLAVASAVVLAVARGFNWVDLGLFAFFVVATGLSVTAGYHRLFAHKAYETRSPIRLAFLLFGAGAFQQSVLDWSADHRRHHREIDSEADPYNIGRGFFWAHMGWLLFEPPKPREFSNVPDLVADRWVVLQDRFYLPLAFLMGFGAPLAAGWALGSPWGGLVWGGLVRIVVVHHATFLVNSLAHTLGKRPYSVAVSARDSFVTALLTFGEGYHNFHHRFASDYRNGIRRSHFDPTKWLIRALASLRLASNLKQIPRERIVAAEVDCARDRLAARLRERSEQLSNGLWERFGNLSAAIKGASAKLDALERERSGRSALRGARIELRRLRSEWRSTLEILERNASMRAA